MADVFFPSPERCTLLTYAVLEKIPSIKLTGLRHQRNFRTNCTLQQSHTYSPAETPAPACHTSPPSAATARPEARFPPGPKPRCLSSPPTPHKKQRLSNT